MIKLVSKIEGAITEVLKSLSIEEQAKIVEGNRPELGQFQYNGAMALAKRNGFAPSELASKICDGLNGFDFIESASVAGVGFVNISVTKAALIEQANKTFSEMEQLSAPKGKTIVIDYGGPNVAKTLHVGHLRSSNIGEAIKRLTRKNGYNVISDVHFGDWGRQMGMIIAEIQERQPDLVFFDPDYQGEYPDVSPVTSADLEEIYPTANIKAKDDEEFLNKCRQATFELQNGRRGYYALWKLFVAESLRPVRKALDYINVKFDLYEGESTVNDMIKPMVAKLVADGVAYESNGATVIDVKQDDDKIDVPPFIVLKSDGAAMYSTTDMATILSRVQRFAPSEIWYVADSRQSLHFMQLFRAVRKAKFVADDVVLKHFGFGTMNGKDGKPFKTRDGGVMSVLTLIDNVKEEINKKLQANEIADETICDIITTATIKFADLSNNRETDFIFDVDKFSALEGKTGPYILYSTVRAKSVLAKAQVNASELKLLEIDNKSYNDVLLNIIKAPMIMEKAFEQKAINIICDYLFALSNSFNNFYSSTKIINGDAEKERAYLKVCELVAKINTELLDVLAIGVPERM